MESLKKHGDPLSEEISGGTPRGADVVNDNDPGSKGTDIRSDNEIVRSANQRPNRPADDATRPPEGIDEGTRSNM